MFTKEAYIKRHFTEIIGIDFDSIPSDTVVKEAKETLEAVNTYHNTQVKLATECREKIALANKLNGMNTFFGLWEKSRTPSEALLIFIKGTTVHYVYYPKDYQLRSLHGFEISSAEDYDEDNGDMCGIIQFVTTDWGDFIRRKLSDMSYVSLLDYDSDEYKEALATLQFMEKVGIVTI